MIKEMTPAEQWDDPATMAVTTYPPVVSAPPFVTWKRIAIFLALCLAGVVILLLCGCAEQQPSVCANKPNGHVVTYKNEFMYGKPTAQTCE